MACVSTAVDRLCLYESRRPYCSPKRARFTVQLAHIGIMTKTRGDNRHFNIHFKLGLNGNSFKYKLYLVLTNCCWFMAPHMA